MEFPDGTTPIATNAYVYHGNDFRNPNLPWLKIVQPPLSSLTSVKNAKNAATTLVKSENVFTPVVLYNTNDYCVHVRVGEGIWLSRFSSHSNFSDCDDQHVVANRGGGDDNEERFGTTTPNDSHDRFSSHNNHNNGGSGGGGTSCVRFGDSVQDVLMTLGAPGHIHYKRHDKLKIHSMMAMTTQNTPTGDSSKNGANHNMVNQSGGGGGSGSGRSRSGSGSGSHNAGSGGNMLTAVDYFYNYFHLGFDVMFNGQSHTVQKIVLHTNFPGSKDFNIYVKCNFTIGVNQFLNRHHPHGSDNRDKKREREEDDEEGDTEEDKNAVETEGVITPDTKYSQIQQYLRGEPCSKPLVNDTTSANNPFGGTRFYAYANCIFEIMKNEHINSVTLFK